MSDGAEAGRGGLVDIRERLRANEHVDAAQQAQMSDLQRQISEVADGTDLVAAYILAKS